MTSFWTRSKKHRWAFGGSVAAILVLLVLLAFLFDPAWVRPGGRACGATVLYDGDCGFCHSTVRWLLSEEGRSASLRFAPLAGPTAGKLLERAGAGDDVPDSVLVITESGRLLLRSEAVMAACGGIWRVAAWLLVLIPRPLRDLAYDLVALLRRSLARAPEGACPLMTPEQRLRFTD